MRAVFNLFNFKQKVDYKTEILSGLTVALALIPEAVAFSIIAGLSPLTGLYAAFTMGLITSIFGGRPGMISGATGAVAVVIVSLAKSQGVEYVFAAVMLAGLIQMIFGFFKMGKFIRLVPQPVMYGFVNGLAIIIFMSQLVQFKGLGTDGQMHWLSGPPMYIMLGFVSLTVFIIWGLPKLTNKIPSALTAILIVSALILAFNIHTKTVGDLASIQGGFPPFHIPSIPLQWTTLEVVFPYALIIAGVGLIESLLTLNLIDEITQTRGSGNREAVAQGTANFVTGLFSGMGGCAMIGQSLINISSGARARLSGIVASIMLLVFIMFGSGLIEKVPMAALTGVMIMVAIGTFEWASFRMIGKMPLHDIIVGVLVAGITVLLHNLALAVLIGVIISALVFAWESAKRIRARKYLDERGVKHYEIFGPLFFASITAFNDKFNVLTDPQEVIIDFSESKVADMSGIEALNKLTERYKNAGKTLHLRHLSEDCRELLKNANDIIEVNIIEDPTYKVATDKIH
jgi:SulP family sulfate permease